MLALVLLAGCGGQAPATNEAVANDVAANAVATPEPEPAQHVIDEAQLLAPATAASIQSRLAVLERNSGKRVLIVTLATLGGRNIDAVSEEIGARLGLADGVLLLIASQDRQMRLSVGRGSMGLLNDREAKHIVEQVMRPDLRANRFEAGIVKGVDRIASELSAVVA
ncbi:TPM domain-containing protein [Sphingomonas sp. G-3-2-10]|uniref:TPM domain-containing protein n=1 Tax=Sphingomonas sp. G-3-2-10 TaxID=2728838 RepID=UPI00146A94D6|nr:TPM domain-containing protein [Sphingomonas sp. G-3-2-10]NML07719.1 TPM domain-containing protein [Sphingomonas sp. G-3-2-10]